MEHNDTLFGLEMISTDFKGDKSRKKSKCTREWNVWISKARNQTEWVVSTKSMRDVCINTRIHYADSARERGIDRKSSWSETKEPGQVRPLFSSLSLTRSLSSHPDPTLWTSWPSLSLGERLCDVFGYKLCRQIDKWSHCWSWMVFFWLFPSHTLSASQPCGFFHLV